MTPSLSRAAKFARLLRECRDAADLRATMAHRDAALVRTPEETQAYLETLREMEGGR